MGDNVGVVNRPNNSNNWFGGNTNNNININNITNNNISNNYYRGGNNWWGGGRGGGYAGWRNPYYGYHSGWYYGGWDRNYFGNAFWGGFAGAMTANAASNLFNLFPTWGSYGYSSWGLTPVVSNTYYSNYVNPYYATPVAAAAQPSVTVYNYSQPLATAAATDAGANAAPAQIDASEAQFQSARDAFKAGNYDDALKLADQALTSVPGDTALHEFRALCLFALGRYTESSAVLYAVLTAGPGWSWSTMIGLYPDVETYTNQLRSLEGYVKQNPNSASGHFVLAYQYMTAGHKEAAASEFQRVATLEPKDQLSSKFVQVLAPAAADNQVAAEPPAPAENATAVADASQTDAKQPTPPPAALVGSWTAKPDDSLTITLAIANEGDFTWTVTPKQGKPQVIKGKALYLEGEMALTQEQGNPLVGKVETPDAGTMKFSLLGDDKAPALVFKKGA